MVAVSDSWAFDKDELLARPFLITDTSNGEARASAKTRELADKALALLTLE